MTVRPDQAAYPLEDPPVVLDVMGPVIEILTEGPGELGGPALLRGTIPAGGVVPMHAHDDPETFYVLSGELEGLVFRSGEEPRWVSVLPGGVFHVPPGARHALRNKGTEPNVALVVSTRQMAEFFEAIGEPIGAAGAARPLPNPQRLARMAQESAKRGYWNASPEENAAVGIKLPPMT